MIEKPKMHHLFQVTPIAHSVDTQIVYMLLYHSSNTLVLKSSGRLSRDTMPASLARLKSEVNTNCKTNFSCFKKSDSYWLSIVFQFISVLGKRGI